MDKEQGYQVRDAYLFVYRYHFLLRFKYWFILPLIIIYAHLHIHTYVDIEKFTKLPDLRNDRTLSELAKE